MKASKITIKETLPELMEKREALQDRIKRLERDLTLPLEADSSEQALQLSNRIILRRLLEVERKNLIWTNFEIEKKKTEENLENESRAH